MIIFLVKDTFDSMVNDVKFYSNGLIIALENKRHVEDSDCVQKNQKNAEML